MGNVFEIDAQYFSQGAHLKALIQSAYYQAVLQHEHYVIKDLALILDFIETRQSGIQPVSKSATINPRGAPPASSGC